MSLSVASIRPAACAPRDNSSHQKTNVQFKSLLNDRGLGGELFRYGLKALPSIGLAGGGLTVLVQSLRNKLGMDPLLTTACGISGAIMLAVAAVLLARKTSFARNVIVQRHQLMAFKSQHPDVL